MKSIYLDHAATTPVRREVLEAMLPFYTERFGNPSSAHAHGRSARAGLEEAREQVAAALGARRSEIVFTSGGTESDNLAILGRARRTQRDAGQAVVACSAVEHKAVMAACAQAAREGAVSIIVGVDSDGRVTLDAIEEALHDSPTVLSVMWVNNETGVLQPIDVIARLCADRGVVLHTDAVQAVARVPVRVSEGISLLSISGHKLGAPKGIGALYIREGTELVSSQHGGSQERGVRPGTENIAAAIGLASALTLAVAERAAEAERLERLRDELQAALLSAIPGSSINSGNAARAPHILSVSLEGVAQDALLVSLDLEGIAVSTASACQSGATEASHVLVAMGRDVEDVAVLRISLGRTNTQQEIADVARTLPDVVSRIRQFATV